MCDLPRQVSQLPGPVGLERRVRVRSGLRRPEPVSGARRGVGAHESQVEGFVCWGNRREKGRHPSALPRLPRLEGEL